MRVGDEDIAELNALYVVPVRKQGVAQALLHEFETIARRNSFCVIRLRAGVEQPEALRFYQKMGFHLISCFGEYASSKTFNWTMISSCDSIRTVPHD